MAGLRIHLPKLLDDYARDKQFVPHPSTWLGKGRWKDEAPKPEDHLSPQARQTLITSQQVADNIRRRFDRDES